MNVRRSAFSVGCKVPRFGVFDSRKNPSQTTTVRIHSVRRSAFGERPAFCLLETEHATIPRKSLTER